MKRKLQILVPLAVIFLTAGCGAGEDGLDSGIDDSGTDDGARDVVEPLDLTGDSAVGHDVVDDAVAPDVAGDAGQDLPQVDPVLANHLQQIMQEHMNFSSDPGMVLSVRTPAGAWWSGAVGMADMVEGVPMTPDSQFRVGSNTKPIVAVVILQLVEEGRIDLDAPLTTYLPQYDEWSDITVRMLLNMRSGLNEFLAIQPCLLSVILEPNKAFTPEEILEFVLDSDDNGRLFPADTAGYYSNTNYVLLGLIIEAVSDKTAEQEIQDRILDPLGMTRTYMDDGTRDDTDLVDGYIDLVAGGVVVGFSPSQFGFLENIEYVDGLAIGTHLMHPAVPWTSGSLVSTSYDMGRFVHALMAGQLLQPGTMEQMADTQPATLLGGLTEYGLGLQNIPSAEGETWGHGGLNFGYQTQTWYLPEHDITISHIHNFLLNWYDRLQNDLVAAVRTGGDPDFSACGAPDGFFTEPERNTYMNWAFKGPVSIDLRDGRMDGGGFFRLVQKGSVQPAAGMYPQAVRAERDGVPHISVVAYGVPYEGDANLTMLTIELGTGLFAGLDAEGTKVINTDNPTDMFGAMTELYWAPGTTVVNKFCYVGFSNPLVDGHAFLCPDNRDGIPEVGDTLRVMGSVPVSSDPDYIDYVLENVIGTDRCVCLNDGAWGSCAD